MTILIVRVVSEGIIFGADRNITEKRLESSSGQKVYTIFGQSQQLKVLRWPNRKALIGYAGVATIGGLRADEWFYDFIGENPNFLNFQSLAEKLTIAVEKQRRIDEGDCDPDSLLIHLAGFEEQNSFIVPVVWFIRNAYKVINGFYSDFRKEYQYSDEFQASFNNIPPDQIRGILSECEAKFNPFGFQQGYDLGSFNSFDFSLKNAFSNIYQFHPDFPPPQSLSDWEKYVKMAILTYGAFFETYNEPGKQFVGGGADIVSLRWPESV